MSISTSGVRSAGGTNPPGLVSGTVGKADFTVGGEATASVSVAVDSSFVMTGPGGSTLTVTTVATNTGTQTLPGSAGNASTGLDVAVGGTITVPSTQQTGAYTGTFNVTATYN